jgi:hypothetical protein
MNIEEKILAANRLSELAYQIALKQLPYDNLIWYKEVRNENILKFHQYRDELNKIFIDNFLQYIKDLNRYKFYICFGILDHYAPEIGDYDYGNVYREFQEWWKHKESFLVPFIKGDMIARPSFNIDGIIRNTILKRYPDCKVAKKKPAYGVKTYYTDFLDNNKLYIGFERSNMRSFMSLCFGLERPWFMVDISTFFIGTQSLFEMAEIKEYVGVINGERKKIFEYVGISQQSAERTINRALDILEALLPHVLKKLCLI